MKCPVCGSEKCQVISEVSSSGKDYSVSKGICGAIICKSPFGLLCGACGKGKQISTQNYWICQDCGKKWKA